MLAPSTLRVHLQPADGTRADSVWQAVHDGLLADSGAEHVTVERGEEPPQRGAGGKFRRVVPLSA